MPVPPSSPATAAAVQIRAAALAELSATLLRPGAVVGAKVLERNGMHGLLLLAGAPVVAELPAAVAEGSRLRLRVTEVGAERVTLQLLAGEDGPAASAGGSSSAGGGHAAAAAAGPGVPAGTAPGDAAFALALPGGATMRLHISEREGGEAGGGSRGRAAALSLRFDSPTLGRLDFRLAPGAVAVHASAGEPAERAAAGADALRAAVERATGTPTQVTVHARGGTVDVRG